MFLNTRYLTFKKTRAKLNLRDCSCFWVAYYSIVFIWRCVVKFNSHAHTRVQHNNDHTHTYTHMHSEGTPCVKMASFKWTGDTKSNTQADTHSQKHVWNTNIVSGSGGYRKEIEVEISIRHLPSQKSYMICEQWWWNDCILRDVLKVQQRCYLNLYNLKRTMFIGFLYFFNNKITAILPVWVLRWACNDFSRGKTRLQKVHLMADGDVDPSNMSVVRASDRGRPRRLFSNWSCCCCCCCCGLGPTGTPVPG